MSDGVCFPVPWTELNAWAQVTQNIVLAAEFAILRAIDVAFCEEMNKELQAFHERQREAQRQDIEAAKRKR